MTGNLPTVLVTRPEAQAGPLCRRLAAEGYRPLLIPALSIVPDHDPNQIDASLEQWQSWDFIVFISVNAVNFAWPLISGKMTGCNARLVAIGAATAQALADKGFPAAITPAKGFDSESLLAMPAFARLKGCRVLLVRGHGGRELLAETFAARGAEVDLLEVYRRDCPTVCPPEALAELDCCRLKATLVTSAQSLDCLMQLMSGARLAKLRSAPLIVFSERIASLAKKQGFCTTRVTSEPGDEAVMTLLKTLP